MAQHTRLPLGICFMPTNQELVYGYLIPRNQGLRLQWDRIAEKDVYSAEPWIVFSNLDDFPRCYWNTRRKGRAIEETVYVFTPVAKTSPKSKKHARRAGLGTWSGQTSPERILHPFTGDVIGCTRMLSFSLDKGASSGDLNHWIMHEYWLVDAGLRAIGERETQVVLCRITKIVKDSDRPLNQQPPLNSYPRAGNAPLLLLPPPFQPPLPPPPPPFQPPFQPWLHHPFQPPLQPPFLPPPCFQAVLGSVVQDQSGQEQLHGESTTTTAAEASTTSWGSSLEFPINISEESTANCESVESPATNAEASTINWPRFLETSTRNHDAFESLIDAVNYLSQEEFYMSI